MGSRMLITQQKKDFMGWDGMTASRAVRRLRGVVHPGNSMEPGDQGRECVSSRGYEHANTHVRYRTPTNTTHTHTSIIEFGFGSIYPHTHKHHTHTHLNHRIWVW